MVYMVEHIQVGYFPFLHSEIPSYYKLKKYLVEKKSAKNCKYEYDRKIRRITFNYI